jgi:hypothetical protein
LLPVEIERGGQSVVWASDRLCNPVPRNYLTSDYFAVASQHKLIIKSTTTNFIDDYFTLRSREENNLIMASTRRETIVRNYFKFNKFTFTTAAVELSKA